MGDIRFEQAIFQQQNKDEISEVVKSYKILISKCSSDTMFQLTHFDLLSKGYELYDYIANNDISATTLDKLKEFVNQVTEELNSGDYLLLKEAAEIVANAKKKSKIIK